MGKATVRIAGKSPPSPTRYADDRYAWALEQVELLLGDDPAAPIDGLNIAEEIAKVGRREFNRLLSALSILQMHLLKWDHQPDKRTPSWVATVREQRRRISRLLEENPSLQSRFAEMLADAYERGREGAQSETGLSSDTFPVSSPYSFEELMQRPVSIDGDGTW